MTNRANLAFGAPNCVTGAIFRAPLGTSLPTDDATQLDPGFINQGGVSADGLSQAITKAYDDILGWCGDTLARPRTSLGVSFTFTLVEVNNPDVATTVWGDQATIDGDRISIAFRGDDGDASSWVFEMKDGNRLRRIVVPDAELSMDSFERNFTRNELLTYPITLTAFPDSNGVYFYEYSDRGTLQNGQAVSIPADNPDPSVDPNPQPVASPSSGVNPQNRAHKTTAPAVARAQARAAKTQPNKNGDTMNANHPAGKARPREAATPKVGKRGAHNAAAALDDRRVHDGVGEAAAHDAAVALDDAKAEAGAK